MQFLHSEFEGGPESLVTVELDHVANVLLMDSTNFSNYKAGRAFRYFGGSAHQSPCRLRPPHHGRWHVAVDLGGRAGSVRARIHVS